MDLDGVLGVLALLFHWRVALSPIASSFEAILLVQERVRLCVGIAALAYPLGALFAHHVI